MSDRWDDAARAEEIRQLAMDGGFAAIHAEMKARIDADMARWQQEQAAAPIVPLPEWRREVADPEGVLDRPMFMHWARKGHEWLSKLSKSPDVPEEWRT